MPIKVYVVTAPCAIQYIEDNDIEGFESYLAEEECIPLCYNFYSGTRQVKLLDSRQIRTIRDVCIFEINGMEVFL